ncbi:DUF3304 domain-containing protein [Paraburkholderia lacunae]|uniref:DUF3304 domain-containing protein n=1 Tax=Paraburkholderia lacunae TaxID=2211104 RepID=A0A370NC54_9BURK|nr:DUF3304 domain-containing protein [Paraburkholderia lacunae]RDK03183.1 hypothetical protein DLM46_09885 [Paraburkholderia lacunae]
MKRIMILLVSIAVLISACARAQPRGYVDATAWSANYTEDYIHEFHIQTASGQDTGLEGIQVGEFSKGGKGGSECCSLIPGVGQTIRVVWTVANTDDKAQWKTYSRDVVVIGSMPMEKDAYNILMVRFFPDHQVEAELIPDRGKTGLPSLRVDKLFSGQRVMRKMGE